MLSKRNPLRMIWPGLSVFVMLCAGCAMVPRTIPDDRIPHQVAREASVRVWVKSPKGFTQEWVVLREGWWIASDRVVNP
jgi:hypothetical protein